MYQNVSIPASAFSNGKGSYSIPQLLLPTGTQFLLTMSDATGFGSGGTTNQLTVGNPVANNNCNTAVSSPPYMFQLSAPLTQCSQFTVTVDSGAVLPITIVQLIPGGQPAVFNSANSHTFTSVVDVNAETNLLYFVTDSAGRQGGISGFEQVLGSSNSSCLSANSPSSTAGTASPTSSSSSSLSGGSSSTNVALIAGVVGGGAAVLIALVILGMCLWRKRRASRSTKSHSFHHTKTTSHRTNPPSHYANPLSHYATPPSLDTPHPTTNATPPETQAKVHQGPKRKARAKVASTDGNGIAVPKQARKEQSGNGIAVPKRASKEQSDNGIAVPKRARKEQSDNGIAVPKRARKEQSDNGQKRVPRKKATVSATHLTSNNDSGSSASATPQPS